MRFCLHDINSGAHNFKVLESLSGPVVSSSQTNVKSDTSEEKVVCILAQCEVDFYPNYFIELTKAFSNQNLAVAYSDFEYKSDFKLADSHIRLPHWSPERYLSNDYLGPIVVMDFDRFSSNAISNSFNRTNLMLECIAKNLDVQLIESVGYQVEALQLDLKQISRKPEIQDFLNKNRSRSEVVSDATPWLQVSNKGLAPNVISVVIPTRGTKKSRRSNEMIVDCVQSLTQQNIGASKVEVVVVYDSDRRTGYLDKLSQLQSENVSIKLVPYEPPFNFSAKCNLGAENSSGDVILFLNDDTLWRSSDSLLELAGSAMIENVGAVGAKLYFENDRLQHAGYFLTHGFVGHAYFRDLDGFGPFGDLTATHEVIGVTGACLAQRRSVWENLGGWDVSFPGAYNDIDYCFRIREQGFSILQVNSARLYHYESITRNPTVRLEETRLIHEKWGKAFGSEPYFRQAVLHPEVKYLRGEVIQAYTRYVETTYRHYGLVGVLRLFTNKINKVRIKLFS
jgi:GT2 family glycosyltransferase